MMGKTIGIAFAVLLGFFALGWAIQGNDFFMYKFWAPKYENVRRETFEQTKSYRQGMIQEMRQAQKEYNGADTQSKKDAIASFILHSAADFPESEMPSDVKGFMTEIRNAKRY